MALAIFCPVFGLYLFGSSFGQVFTVILGSILGASFLLFFFLGKKANEGKKACRTSLIILRVLFILWLISFVAVQLVISSWERQSDDIANIKADYILVLGAKVSGSFPSYSLKARLDAAAEYLDMYEESRAVVCGGQGPDEPYTEAFVMKKYLISKGIPENRIITEDKSTSTFENILFAKNIIDEIEGSDTWTAAVSTNDFHLFRACRLLDQAGLGDSGISKSPDIWQLEWGNRIREYFSIMFALFTGKFS